LLIGYGNPGRHDDGLGPALAHRLEQAELAGVDIDSDYQLNIEHAYELAAYEVVIFADAAHSDGTDSQQPFFFRPLAPGNPTSFSTHSVSPQAVMRLACDLFQAKTQAYVLGIVGYEFKNIGEGLTPEASNNLDQAEAFLTAKLENLRGNEVAGI
jgi:hydrogenase maturation protease